MVRLDQPEAGHFCWLDLATSDAGRARAFYAALFGWKASDQPANGGSFTRLHRFGRDVGSLYQLQRSQLAQGAPSHWTPYVRVDDADDAARCAASLGGEVIVRPFAVADIARIALIADSTGAHVGLWQDTTKGTAHG